MENSTYVYSRRFDAHVKHRDVIHVDTDVNMLLRIPTKK